MSNIIKEILNFNEDADYKRLSVDEMIILKDYINNLQDKIDKANTLLRALKGSARWEKHLYEIDELINTLRGDK